MLGKRSTEKRAAKLLVSGSGNGGPGSCCVRTAQPSRNAAETDQFPERLIVPEKHGLASAPAFAFQTDSCVVMSQRWAGGSVAAPELETAFSSRVLGVLDRRRSV